MPAPLYSPRTVYFIGNGVLRVPSWIVHSNTDPGSSGRPLPSWNKYLAELWGLITKAQGEAGTGKKGGLKERDFRKLSAPRQAEWFDRQIMQSYGTTSQGDAAGLRLHLLGKTFHSAPGVLTNKLVQRLAQLFLRPLLDARSRGRIVDVMTTNLDCALEQNIALAAEQAIEAHGEQAHRLKGLTLDVKAGLNDSVVWRRGGPGAQETARIRIWKLHGCLRDLRASLASRKSALWAMLQNLQQNSPHDEPFAGHVPECCLAEFRLENWTLVPQPSRSRRPFTGVFSQTEYFRMMNLLTGKQRRTGSASLNLATFRQLLQERPMLFVGYGLAEVDVDILGALHLFRPPKGIRRWTLKDGGPKLNPSEAERLQQMGIEWWEYQLPPVAFCLPPGELDYAARHEWRHREKDLWQEELAQLSAETWLEPQVDALGILLGSQPQSGSPRMPRPIDLVAAGLGSIWHGFTLLHSSDFPSPRRASARLMAVDHQVPGGSGLVPIMVAAAIAGPSAAGRLQFFSNVPADWSGWNEIKELCLSAGISIHPYSQPADLDKIPPVGRTSHVLYFDEARRDSQATAPRQRFIMDVQSFTRPPIPEISARKLKKIAVPKVPIPADAAAKSKDVLLFADKEVDLKSLRRWRGPVVFETGATGDELIKLPRGVHPSVWTAGIGSFVRTLTLLAGRKISSEQTAGGVDGVLQHLNSHPVLSRLTACREDLQHNYLCRLLSFNLPLWEGGFTHKTETAYGRWLRDRWLALTPELCSLLGLGSLSPVSRLARDHRIGRGVLTTVHEAGLMAIWQIGESGYISIVSAVTPQSRTLVFRCHVETVGHLLDGPLPPTVILAVAKDNIRLAVEGCSGTFEAKSQRPRRNTLGAGDAVRGCLSYGLSNLATGGKPGVMTVSRLAHVLHAACVLASLKCYTGSFVKFLTVLTRLRREPLWNHLWGPAAGHQAP